MCSPLIGSNETSPIDEAPSFCPMKLHPQAIQKAASQYANPEVKEFAHLASVQEAEGYERSPGEGVRARLPRIEEVIQFAHKCGYKKLGVVFCIGLAREAQILTEILGHQEFEVISVCCKLGAVHKDKLGLEPSQKIGSANRWESMCNPIAQAEVMNVETVDLGIMLGLCAGHDALFIQHCRVPLTVLAVKDRVTGHNPLAPLYLSTSY